MKKLGSIVLALTVSIPCAAAQESDATGPVWRWSGYEVVGQRTHTRDALLVGAPIEIGSTFDREQLGVAREWARGLQERLDLFRVDCGAVRYADGGAWLVVDVIEKGDEARARFRPEPEGDAQLEAPRARELAEALEERSSALFEAGTPSSEFADEGFLDYADPEMHALVLELRTALEGRREKLFEVIETSSDARRRAQAARLLNWAGDVAESVARVAGLLDDPSSSVRNDLARFALHYVDRVDDPEVRERLVRAFATMLERPSHGDRNKAVYALLHLAQAFEEDRPRIATAARPALERLAEQSLLSNVRDPALELLGLLPEEEEADPRTNDERPVLAEAPAEWRRERLALPLSFAPELEFEGYEDLAFAPGMFEPGSDSWFSYALVLHIEDDLAIDEDFLRSFLDTYYRGLCRTVGASRGLEIEDADVTTQVSFDGSRGLARIDMIEPFVTGEALVLHLELDVRPGARTTQILGLASPLSRDAPIWSELRAIRERWLAVSPPALLLNHVYFVPDAETYAAIAGSPFLRETFAVSEERTTNRRDRSYTGVYFYGRNTYFEFLSPDASAGFAPGGSGVAFGIETEGGTAAFAEELGRIDVNTFAGEITRELEDEQVPWFKILGVEIPEPGSQLSLFTMEYDTRFLAEWHADHAPRHVGIARHSVLERYATHLDQRERRTAAPLADVTEVHLALAERERARLVELCGAAGYVVERSGDEWVCDGPGVVLRVRASQEPGGVRAIVLALQHPVEREPLELGAAVLTFRGETAVLGLP